MPPDAFLIKFDVMCMLSTFCSSLSEPTTSAELPQTIFCFLPVANSWFLRLILSQMT